ncbi:MAG: FHA domain-containing protein [Alphaproteobacteria bacterium]|nr:FHA domain-containing protein [Alphaproteobacteria bacterium]
MTKAVQLFVLRSGEEIPGLTLGSMPLYVGRSPDNHLVVPDATVSTRHAAFWVEGGRAWVRDCGSRNGTFLNDRQVQGACAVRDGDRVRLGTSTALVVRGQVAEQGPLASGTLRLLEDVEAEVCYPLITERFIIGDSELADLRLDQGAEEEASLTVHPDGEIWVSTFDSERALDVGDTFSVGGRQFRVVDSATSATATHDASTMRFPYKLEITLDGVQGAQAEITDPRSGRSHVIDAENRAVLLYLLGRQASQAKDDPAVDSWCADEDVAVGIWGRKGTSDANSLHVLVHRLRKELKKAGFDPWFIEKRRRAIRLSLDDVVLG